MWEAIAAFLIFLVGFVVGLLVGRRNPKIADAAANAANAAKTGASEAADAAKSAVNKT